MFKTTPLVCAAASLVIVWGCGGSASTDPAPGTEVTITTPDGQVITGQVAPKPDAEPPSAAEAPPAAADPEPAFTEVTVPAGTTVSAVLQTALASDVSRVEDPVQARVSEAVMLGGEAVIPKGSMLHGSVLNAEASGKVKGLARLSYRFDRLDVDTSQYGVRSKAISHEAKSTKTDDAKKIGIGAGAGALVGGLLGGKKGAGVGTVVGGGAGTTMVLTGGGDEVELGVGHKVNVRLQDPIVVLVPRS